MGHGKKTCCFGLTRTRAKYALTIKLASNELVMQENGQPANGFKLIFSNNTNFTIPETPSAAFRMLTNAAGKVDALELKQSRETYRLPKMQ